MTTCEGTATANAMTTATATATTTATARTTATDARLRRPLQVEDGKRDALRGDRLGDDAGSVKSGGRTAALPWHLARGFLLLRLFGADFAEEFFTAKFAFFLDDDFAEVGPGGF